MSGLDKLVQDYKNPNYATDQDGRAVECGDQGQNSPGEGSVCKIDQDALFKGPCKNETAYGFRDGTPCILLKLNKIFNWKPVPYTNSSLMPDDIPESIKNAFDNNLAEGKAELVSSMDMDDKNLNNENSCRMSVFGWSVREKTPLIRSISGKSIIIQQTG